MILLGSRPEGPSVAEGIAREQRDAERYASVHAELHGAPNPDAAELDLERKTAAVTEAERIVAAKREACVVIEDSIGEAAMRLDRGAYELEVAESEAAGRKKARVDALIAGVDPPADNLELLDVEIIARHRRDVSVLQSVVDARKAPLDAAKFELDAALKTLASAKYGRARAALMVSSAPLADVIARLSPKLETMREAATTDVELRECDRAREQLTQIVRPVLDKRTQDIVPRIRTLKAEPAPVDGIEMIVRGGQNYGGHVAGDHVMIERRELANRSVTSTLMTLTEAAELDATRNAVEAEREEKRGILSPIVSAVEAGLARLSAKGRAEAAAKAEAEERRRRSDENLARLVEHQLAVAASATPEELATRVILEQRVDTD